MTDKAARQKKRNLRSIITYGALGAIIVVLTLYVIFRNTDRIQYKIPAIESVASADIESIRIVSEANGTIEVRRSGEIWSIGPEGYLIDNDRLEDMIEAIEDFTISELVSTAKYYERYELDEGARYEVIVSGDGATLLRFDLGKRSPSYNHTYVRLAGDDRVFQAEGNLQSIFDKDVDALRDKLVFTIDPALVASVGVTMQDETYRVYRAEEEGETVWKSDDDTQWDAEAISAALDRLAKLQCQTYLDEKAAGELETPAFVLEIQEEKSHQFFIYGQSDSSYNARSSQSRYAFNLSTYVAEQITDAFDRSKTEDE